MPVLVTKNVMAASCALAGCAAISRQPIAAKPENARKVVDAETGIGSSQILLGRLRRRRSFRLQPVSRDIIPAQNTETTSQKGRRETDRDARCLISLQTVRSAGSQTTPNWRRAAAGTSRFP